MKFVATLNILLSVALSTEAFVVQTGSSYVSHGDLSAIHSTARVVVASHNGSRQSTVLYMSSSSSSSSENEDNVDTEARTESGEGEEEAAAPPPAEEQEEQEDPELVAIKEEIAQLESTLKEKRRELAYVSDKAEEYSKSGYARRVAEMENMRRARSMLASSNKSGAMAGVLTTFLPVLDSLGELQNKYGDDEFGKSYNALQSIMEQVYTDLGVKQYTVTTGDKVDMIRMNVVEKVHSEEYPADTVIQPLTTGWELQGNVIRPVECVASLGPEKVEEEGEEETPGNGVIPPDPQGFE